MVDGIPGSSPNWREANMKTKGRAVPAEVPPSHLGSSASGLAAWGSSATTAETKSRRHYHQSQLAQTTAWDCLPCVDAADKQAGSTPSSISTASTTRNSSSSSSSKSASATSLSLALGNREWRRHRRQVPAPPCTAKPQGKRMLHTAAPQSTCKDLLQDPQPPARPARTAAAAVTAAAAATAVANPCTQQCPSDKNCMQHNRSKGGSSFSSRTPGTAAAGALSSSSSSSGASLQPHQATSPTATAAAAPGNKVAAAAAAQPGCTRKGGRVEDDPNYFRTPKDPPTLQRFADSLAQMSLGKSSALSTVQRHEAGIRARQQAQVTAAAREVAALDAGAQPDAD